MNTKMASHAGVRIHCSSAEAGRLGISESLGSANPGVRPAGAVQHCGEDFCAAAQRGARQEAQAAEGAGAAAAEGPCGCGKGRANSRITPGALLQGMMMVLFSVLYNINWHAAFQ